MPARKTAEVAVRNAEFEQWVEVMKLQADQADENPFDARDLMVKANQASTFEEVVEILNGGGTRSARDLVGIVHTINSYELRRSDSKFAGQGLDLGVFAVVMATVDGEELIYTTGATNILAILWQAEKFDRFPLKAAITSRETANGELLSLKPVTV
jgi:hypothetical protein